MISEITISHKVAGVIDTWRKTSEEKYHSDRLQLTFDNEVFLDFILRIKGSGCKVVMK